MPSVEGRAPAASERWDCNSELARLQVRLDGSNGFADVTAAQAPGPEWTGTVLAERWEGGDRPGDGVGHCCDLAAGLRLRHGVIVATCGQCRCLCGVPGRTERMCSHVRDGGGLLGGVCRCSGCWCRRFPRSGTRFAASTSKCVADAEFARSKGASLIDRGSHSCVVRHGVLEDDKYVLGAVGRPRRNRAAILDAQGLRGGCHRVSVGTDLSVIGFRR